MVEVSIIIPSYNRKEILKSCLEALFNQNFPKDDYEIILIDDGSTDDTEKMVKSLSPPCRLTYIKNERRLGQSISRNKGIKEAKGKYLIFVDSDIIVIPDFTREHLKFHNLYKEVVVNGELIYISSLDQVGKKKKSIWDISFSPFNTANVSVKKEYVEKVGGFDTELFPYGWQDIELGYRLKKMGLRIKKNPKALGYHFKKETKNEKDLEFLKEKEFMRGKSGALFLKKHPSLEVKLSVKGNPLFCFAFIGRFLEENPKGKKFFAEIQKKNIKWLNAAFFKLILCHFYLKGYNEQVKKRKIINDDKKIQEGKKDKRPA
ncbi:glycosyltransferase family 2 protein [Candidatus Aerophobetes bacterium]|nr:glycosyltransferase family 2 protein [Candidatus Aerophobetes bacterium]